MTRAPRMPTKDGASGQAEGAQPARDLAAGTRPLTAARIRNIAEHYVGQRESSARMLRNVLERRLQRRLRSLAPEVAAEEREAVLPLIDAEIARLEAAGVLQDARYAEMKARSALSSGRGGRRILQDLARKGIASETAREALLEAAREVAGTAEPDLDQFDLLRTAEAEAADVFARKRRLGPYRTEPLPEDRSERSRIWRREAAAMTRAGFGLDTIRWVLDRQPEEN
ncbi:regulatory protein RecX [Rubellimicrobium roseum]|uniref:Regulatory protein RecX n=1 Tax=Rubellimicrobium roseum TaxID=687525 RepID=A0A5C4NB62_9RHOB|nr:RecX family transcriptional regulator [Rubellimicrobium roseum]TNC63989.1 hypothetical protein FHG71_18805 [Rubellimicrobium roseum]